MPHGTHDTVSSQCTRGAKTNNHLAHCLCKSKGTKCKCMQLLMELHLTATECHLSYEITQCYLPPDTSEHTPALTTARQAGIQFTYPGGMEG